jgi:hypothetical protein
MNHKQVSSKMSYHAALAYTAWNNGNLTDYLIEHARFELARRHLARMDQAAAALYFSVTNPESEEA